MYHLVNTFVSASKYKVTPRLLEAPSQFFATKSFIAKYLLILSWWRRLFTTPPINNVSWKALSFFLSFCLNDFRNNEDCFIFRKSNQSIN